MRWFACALLVALLMLQYRLWFTNDGVRDVLRLQAAVAAQQQQNASLEERNQQLAAEVRDLKQGYAALEERARADLGMIAANETFYQVVVRDLGAPAAAPASRADQANHLAPAARVAAARPLR